MYNLVLYLLLINYIRIESVNSDGQQFHQYQQNEYSPLTSKHNKRPWHEVGDPDPDLEQAQKFDGG